MAKVLELVFTTANNKIKTVSVDAPVETLDVATIQAAMQQMLASTVIHVEGQPLQAIKAARYVERTVTDIL